MCRGTDTGRAVSTLWRPLLLLLLLVRGRTLAEPRARADIGDGGAMGHPNEAAATPADAAGATDVAVAVVESERAVMPANSEKASLGDLAAAGTLSISCARNTSSAQSWHSRTTRKQADYHAAG